MTNDRAKPGFQISPSSQDGSDAHAVDTQAAAWLVRRENGIDVSKDAGFQAWLATDPAHKLAFDEMSETWNLIDEIALRDVARLKSAMERSDLAPASAARRRFIPRAALAGAALAVVGGGWIGWDYSRRQPTFQQACATGRGQLLTVPLPDGSTVELDTDSRIEVTLDHQRREVRLASGQAMFAVRTDRERPFNVFAGTLQVTVVGTRFSVRYTHTGLMDGRVQVAVEEGRVRVAPDDHSKRQGGFQTVELTAGQEIAADSNGMLEQMAEIEPGNVGLWRQGRVSFDNTPLNRAIEEFERYENTHLVIRDPAVGSMRITGSFDLKEVVRFARALPRVLPVRLQERNGTTEIVRVA
ncbi:FecR family protein [Paraburkholderia xenovorans]